ncbi:hypothetical protein ACS3UN_00810 [Oscillospiraceae bacterium LTW-04]|nr:hypothetical protein RBH76_09635 [Oscillospiraceae bacterium MB24-C1]
MKTRLIALLLCVSLVAGCGAASSQGDAGSSSQTEYVPSYTYVNPNPDMVMITSPGGDITYENYRLYLDVNEQFGRFYSRQEMASCAVLESDLKEMGIEINEDDYKNMAAQQVYSMMMYSPSYAENLQQIIDITGMTQEEVSNAMLLPYRSQYLVGLLGDHYQKLAEEELDKEATASQSSEAESASESETSSGNSEESEVQSPEDAAAQAEAERQQAIYEKGTQMMQDYFADYDTRLSFDDDAILATIDGKAVPYTDEIKHYLEYTATASRIDAVAFIQAGELVLRELERRNTELDRTNFETTLNAYTDQIRADETIMKQLEKICASYEATVDDYFKVLERPLWLQEVGDRYYIAMADEYNALTVDSGEKPDSSDGYYAQEFSKLLEGSEIVNVTGE